MRNLHQMQCTPKFKINPCGRCKIRVIPQPNIPEGMRNREENLLKDSQTSPKKSLKRPIAALALAAAATLAAAQAPTPPPAPPPAPQPRFVVVLDAAHGGDDSGGALTGQPEKSFTLALSVRLRSLLSARGIQVTTTRESDANLDADRRAQIANHANAQACLSLHATQTGSGIHLFVSSLAPAPSTRLSAWKTAQSAAVTRSLALAGVVNSVLLHANLPVTLGRTSLPTLDSMTCPAIAIEIAPIRPGAHLDDPAYQAQIAESLAAAMLEWKTEDRQP